LPDKPPRRPIGKRPVTGTPPITDRRQTTGTQPVSGKRPTVERRSTTRTASQRLLEAIEPDPIEAKATWRQMWKPAAFIAVGFALWALAINGAYGSTMFLVKCLGIVLAIYGIVAWARIAPAGQVMTWGALLQAPLVIHTGAVLGSTFNAFGIDIPILPVIGIALLIAGFVRWARGQDSWLTRSF
jgi:predicted signal transduction protein with EAL and GGDEF domain